MVDQIPSVCVCVCARENNICNKTISFVITTSQIMSIDKLRAEAQSASRGEVMYLEKKINKQLPGEKQTIMTNQPM